MVEALTLAASAERIGPESDQKVLLKWNLDPESIDKVRELQKRLSDISHPKNCIDQLVRFLRARAFVVDAAEKMFRSMITWRQEVGADTILQNFEPPQFLRDYYPARTLQNTDKEGDPVLCEKMGKVDLYGLIKEFGQETMLKHAIWIREKMFGEALDVWARGPNGSHEGRRLTLIADMAGLTMSAVASVEVLKLLQNTLAIDQSNYPESAKKLILLNTPWGFQAIWNLVKNWMDEGVREKMVIVSPADQSKMMDEYIGLENLPDFIGGGINTTIVNDSSYFPAAGKVSDFEMPTSTDLAC